MSTFSTANIVGAIGCGMFTFFSVKTLERILGSPACNSCTEQQREAEFKQVAQQLSGLFRQFEQPPAPQDKVHADIVHGAVQSQEWPTAPSDEVRVPAESEQPAVATTNARDAVNPDDMRVHVD